MAIKWNGLAPERKSPGRDIVEQNREWIEKQRLEGKAWSNIAGRLGITKQTLLLFIDPKKYEAEKERKRLKKEQERRALGIEPGRPSHYRKISRVAEHRPEILGELPPLDTRDLTARLMGDPLSGRSYLDRMRQQQGGQNG